MRKTASAQFDRLQSLVHNVQFAKEKLQSLEKNECKSFQITFSRPSNNRAIAPDYLRFDVDSIEDAETYSAIEELIIHLEQKRLHEANQKMQKAMEDLQTMVKEATA